VVPAPNNYDIKRNIEIVPIRARGPCLFGATFSSYRRTMDISKDVKVYENAAV